MILCDMRMHGRARNWDRKSAQVNILIIRQYDTTNAFQNYWNQQHEEDSVAFKLQECPYKEINNKISSQTEKLFKNKTK